ncbi:MAG TPA: RMD1 family protein [Alphaproteobacteria bacterium]|nr:RMD1 family protein [Alphaproteobacteria bacterium]
MNEQTLSRPRTMAVRAVLLSERLDARARRDEAALAAAPLVVRVGESGFAVLFRYGAVVLFGLSAEDERQFLDSLVPQLRQPFAVPESEDTTIVVNPQAEERLDAQGRLLLKTLTTERLQVVAHVLAKSVVLAHYEIRLAAVFDRIDPLADTLRRFGRTGARADELLRLLGDVLLIQHRMVGRVEVGESPEVLWEYPELERLHARLSEEYELRERDLALTRKLDVIAQTAETLLELVQNKHSLRVEWYIVLLIVAEIALTLTGKFGVW